VLDGWISMSQILVFIYQGLIKNHSFIIRRSWDWIHIHQSNLVLNQGLESISKQKQDKKTHKQIKKKQNKTSKTKTKQK
jgi:hypothetical protein